MTKPCCGAIRARRRRSLACKRSGIGEIVVKNGPNSALVASASAQEFVPVPEVVVPVDPTAAGDGFNAGYLAARSSGQDPAQAVSAAHRLAGDVIRHPGALVPRTAVAMH